MHEDCIKSYQGGIVTKMLLVWLLVSMKSVICFRAFVELFIPTSLALLQNINGLILIRSWYHCLLSSLIYKFQHLVSHVLELGIYPYVNFDICCTVSGLSLIIKTQFLHAWKFITDPIDWDLLTQLSVSLTLLALILSLLP